MCFDTTSANTGHLKGACTILEGKFVGRELLWLPCRHHIMEIILAKVFSLCFGPSSSPDIQIFKRFKSHWKNIDKGSFQSLTTDEETDRFKNETLEYLSKVDGWKVQPRDDYKELVKLTLTVLGKPPENIHWRAPGSVHHARWMAKLIYGIKIYLFRNQKNVINLINREEAQLKRFVTFGTSLYTAAWIKAPLAAEAPSNDLQLWRDLKQYEAVDKEISTSTLKVLERHLWYISEDLVGLAIFSDQVTSREKKDIVAKMSSVSSSPRMVRGNQEVLKRTANPKLCNFATTRSKAFFQRMNIRTSFLNSEPDLWKENPDFTDGIVKVKNLLVVNDVAERSVKMCEDFNKYSQIVRRINNFYSKLYKRTEKSFRLKQQNKPF